MSFVNPNTWHLICNNFNLNFIFDIVCLFVYVYAFSLHRESPDMILEDKSLIFEVVLPQFFCEFIRLYATHSPRPQLLWLQGAIIDIGYSPISTLVIASLHRHNATTVGG
jgi:hypothetical protein